MTRPTPTQGAQSEAARVPLDELARQAKAAFEAMSPVDQAMHRLDQKRSGIHGSAPFDSPVSRAERDAVIDAWPEYVVLAAYRDERQASSDKDATIADLERRLAEAERDNLDLSASGSCVVANKLIDERARADALQARLTEAEQRAAVVERRGFEAGRDAAAVVADGRASEARHLACMRGATESIVEHAQERLGAYTCVAAAIRALTPPDAPQEGETTP